MQRSRYPRLRAEPEISLAQISEPYDGNGSIIWPKKAEAEALNIAKDNEMISCRNMDHKFESLPLPGFTLRFTSAI